MDNETNILISSYNKNNLKGLALCCRCLFFIV